MKKLLSIAISVLLLITAAVPAFAATEIAYDGSSVILSGAVDNAPGSAVVTVIVVKPDEDGNETDIAKILEAESTEDYLELIEYLGIVKLDEDGAFAQKYAISLKDSLSSGTCGIYVNYLGRNELVKLGDFYHISAEELNALVGSFNEDDADYVEILSEENLFMLSRVGIDSEKYNDIADKANFAKILKGFAPFKEDMPNEDMSAVQNFSVSFNEALALQEVKENDTLTVLDEYNGKYWNLSIGEEDDFTNLSNKEDILEDIKNADYARASLLEKDFIETVGISVFTVMCKQKSDIENFILNYGEGFGLDVDKYKSEDLDSYARVNVCTYMLSNKKDAKDAETLRALYNSALASLKADNSSSSGSTSGSGSGSSGGSSSGGGSAYKPPVVEITAESRENQTKPLPFRDVAVTHWAYSYVSELYNSGVVSGKEEGTFSPDASITKEEFVKLVVCALGLNVKAADASFSDVTADAWYAPYVSAAVKAGLISGKADGSFGIGDTLSRQDAAVILSRALAASEKSEKAFADQAEISTYAQDAISVMSASGIITGYADGTFKPLNSISRAESCAVLCRLLDKKGGAK